MPFATHAPAVESAEAFRALVDETPMNPNRVKAARASAEVWRQVLDRYPDLAVWVAANRHVPDEIVSMLAAHPRIPVRVAVASHPDMDHEVLMRLAHDKSDLVRMRIACNHKTPREVLAQLVADSCVVVSKHAQARLQYDIDGVMLPSSYLDEVSMFDILH